MKKCFASVINETDVWQRTEGVPQLHLIYSDEIGGLVASMGFKGMLTEGAKHVLGWKSPHYVYHCNQAPSLKLLLRDFKLSDDIGLRFSNSEWPEYPLFADKYINWIDALPQEEQVINIFMELSALGMAQPLSSNILEFLKALPDVLNQRVSRSLLRQRLYLN